MFELVARIAKVFFGFFLLGGGGGGEGVEAKNLWA